MASCTKQKAGAKVVIAEGRRELCSCHPLSRHHCRLRAREGSPAASDLRSGVSPVELRSLLTRPRSYCGLTRSLGAWPLPLAWLQPLHNRKRHRTVRRTCLRLRGLWLASSDSVRERLCPRWRLCQEALQLAAQERSRTLAGCWSCGRSGRAETRPRLSRDMCRDPVPCALSKKTLLMLLAMLFRVPAVYADVPFVAIVAADKGCCAGREMALANPFLVLRAADGCVVRLFKLCSIAGA